MNHNDETDTAHAEAPIAGLQSLDLSEQPTRDLWPGIENRLTPRRRVNANAWMSLAAAACVMTVIGLALFQPQAPSTAPVTMTASAAGSYSPDLQAVAGSRALVKANLQLSRNSETQIRRALEQDPDSPSLHRLLMTTQARGDELHRMLAARST